MTKIFQHFAFADPWWLLLLLVLPPLFFLKNSAGAKSGISFPSLSILSSVGRRPREFAGTLSFFLLCLAILTGILALARPQWQNRFTNRSTSGIDILIALDVSDSMRATDFVQPGTRRGFRQRIDAAKEVIEGFIRKRPDDRFGMVVFGAHTYSISPITFHHDWLISRMKTFQIGDIDPNRTAVGSAIAAAATKLSDREAKSKIVVLVTDGESNAGRLDPVQAADLAASLGIRVYTVGIGADPSKLPPAFLPRTGPTFDPAVLKEVARLTKGEFFLAQDNQELSNTFSSIDELEKSKSEHHTVVDAKDLFPWLLGATFLLSFLSLSATALNPPPAP